MKKFILLALTLLTLGNANAQLNIYNLKTITLEEEADYKNAEPVALEVANLLLAMPIDKAVTEREDAGDFLYNWMIGTPDYVFGTGRMRIILGEDLHLIGISFAAQVKYALENQRSVRNEPEAQKAVWMTIAEYVSNKQNHVSMTPKLKELCRAFKSGQIDEFIKKHE
jgi:hypothetical protein